MKVAKNEKRIRKRKMADENNCFSFLASNYGNLESFEEGERIYFLLVLTSQEAQKEHGPC